MIKVRIEDEPPQEEFVEFTRFGEKIVLGTGEIWVKDCITGAEILKRDAHIFRRDNNGNFYWIGKTSQKPADDSQFNLIPSKWDEI